MRRSDLGVWLGLLALASLVGCPRDETQASAPLLPSTEVAAASAQGTSPVLRVNLPPSEPRRQVPLDLTPRMLSESVRTGVLIVQLADGSRFPVAIRQAKPAFGGRTTVVGRVRTPLGMQSAVLTFGPDSVSGVLPQPDGPLLSINTVAGQVVIGRDRGLVPDGVDPARHPDYRVPAMPTPGNGGQTPRTALSGAPSKGRTLAAAPAEVRIDVLGLYSDELVAMEGSVEAAETELANTIAVATQAHVDSGSRVRLALVATRQVTVPPGIFNDAALYAITDNALEGVDLEALRDAAGADLVMLLRPYTPGDPSCGIAWLAGSGRQRSNVYPESGFSVSNVCGQYVVAHELAHNMGSTHDRVTEARPDGTLGYGAYAYSFGYQQDGPPAFATIMSYFGPQVGYFSNPLNDGCGAPCGVAEIADNVRSLNNMATAIAAFRGPPGSVSIADVDGLEPVDGQERDQRVPVLLSGAAPPGGVTLEIQVLDGTAKAGVDYRLPSDTTLYIPEGEREAPFSLTLIGDDKVEPDETVILKLVGVTGASLHDAEALLTIGNDDPRLVLSGAVRFPAGATPPSVPFPLYSSGGDGGFYSPSLTHWVSPPDFRFEIQAVEDSEIDLFGDAPEPFMAPYTNMGALHADTERDYYLVRGAVLVTSVAVPEGDPMPTGSIPFQLAWSEAPVSYQMNADYSPPDYSYRQVFVPGTVVDLWITPPAPYQRYVERLRMDADVTHVARLSTSNSLAVRSPAWVSEAAGTTVAIVFELASAPATAVTLDYRTRSRSASRAEDYVHASGSLTFAPGETEKQVNLEILDDDRFEPTEYFELLTENLQGATTRNGTQRIDIRDDDATTGGPGPKQPSP